MQPTHNEQTLWQQNRKFNTPNSKAADKVRSKVQNQSNSDIAPPHLAPTKTCDQQHAVLQSVATVNCNPYVNFTTKKLQDFVRFWASAAKQMITAIFWVVTQRVVVILYRRSGSRIQDLGFVTVGPMLGFLTLEDGTGRVARWAQFSHTHTRTLWPQRSRRFAFFNEVYKRKC